MSFPRYPRYKTSGIDWLGEVPVHWELKSLRNIFSFSKGLTITKDDLQDDGVFCVNYGEIHSKYGFRLNPKIHPLRCVPFEYLVSSPSALINDGDFVFADTSEDLEGSGNFSHLEYDRPLFAGYHTIIGRPSKEVSSLFIAYQLHSPEVRSQIQSKVKGIKVFSISQAILKSVKCWLPSASEQKAIASFLDVETSKIDGLVSEQRRLLELLKEKRQAVINHAVTKGLNPNAPMKPSGIQWLGDVPEHWNVYRVGVLYSDTDESGNAELPVLQVSIHHGVSDRELSEEESDRKITRIEDKSKYKRVLPNDLVYNMMRAWQGGFGTVKVEGMVSPAYVVARPKRNFHTQYIEHLFRTPQAIEQMRRYSHGVTDFRLRLYWDKFKNVQVALPPISEQQEICKAIDEITSRFDVLSAEAERAIELLQERRTALISAAVTGKIDVRGFAS